MHAPLANEISATLRPVASATILYADVDRLGIVYHAQYFCYLELARVELLRSGGLSYAELERAGLALPLTETAVKFIAPALYDDKITIHAGLSLVSRVRMHVQYRVLVMPGDRTGLDETVEILTAETRHCCVLRDGTRPTRLPAAAYELLAAQC